MILDGKVKGNSIYLHNKLICGRESNPRLEANSITSGPCYYNFLCNRQPVINSYETNVNRNKTRARPSTHMVASETCFFSRQDHRKEFFLDISHPLDRRKELKMAVIAVGSRPETPDVTKFFELPAVDRRFEGRVRGGGEKGLRILGIHISVGGRGGGEGGGEVGGEVEVSQV